MADYENQKILPVELEREMKKSFMEYAMSVITARALPDVRDGLKPVHRRILYTMHEEGLTPDKSFRKSVTAVGDVLGRYHPHGDSSVYDALVRMAQDFSLRYMLIEGHGNFGSTDGDPPAAYRYTEARMSKISLEMLTDIDKETVDFVPNFDGRRVEPTVLPARFPNLLVNGSEGIAVGMTTKIPPHNLCEVVDAVVCLLDEPEAGFADLMEHIKGPDFPTRGIILGAAGIRAAYATGKGRVKVRARAEIEEMKGNRSRIVVTELPYQCNKSRLVVNIAELVHNKTIEGISDLRDESDRTGTRVVIEIKREANANVVLNQLYAATEMQSTFSINMLALVNGTPKVLTLKEMLEHYIAHQFDVIERRTRYDLKKAKDRAHVVEGLLVAAHNSDEVVAIIRSSRTVPIARERLQERFELSEIQAKAITDMQLGQLTGLGVDKLETEHAELLERIADLEDILRQPGRVRAIIREELLEVKRRFGDERRTELQPLDDEIDLEDLIEREDCVFTITGFGYVKRLPADTYRAQRRGGRGVTAQTMREEDYVKDLFVASTHDTLLFFTNYGRLFRKRGFHIPEAGRTAKGMNVVNLMQLEDGEKISAVIPVTEDDSAEFLVMITRNGTVKRISLGTLETTRKGGIRALNLDEGDELIAVRKTDGKQDILIATRDGMVICFKETDVRAMGRQAIGVRGIRLSEGDYVIGAARARSGGTLLSVTENGFGKRTELDELRRGAGDGEERVAQRRGGKGLRGHMLSDKTGKVADIKVVDETDDILIISDDGTIIRLPADSVNVYGRTAQGVKVMRLAEGSRVISTARTAREESENAEDSGGTEATEATEGTGE